MKRRKFVKLGTGAAALSVMPHKAFALTSPTNADRLSFLETKPLTHFAFGSCNRQNYSQAYWNTIALDKPELWVWMGDNIYANDYSTAERMAVYNKLKADKNYASFRALTPIIGTWDDHDFRNNDGDGQWSGKDGSRVDALAFLDTPPDKVEGHQGIYQSYLFGPEGKRTKIILLDLRFNMVQQRGLPASLLGEQQWEWFKDQINMNDYELLVIGSSQNVLSPSGAQAWASFPAERAYLYQWLKPLVQPVLFLSGDRHHGDFSKLNIGGKFVYEFMSSGLTHCNWFSRFNPNRIGKAVTDYNYGLIDIDWSGETPRLSLKLKGSYSGRILQETKI
jgi:alkaline phosphatase D